MKKSLLSFSVQGSHRTCSYGMFVAVFILLAAGGLNSCKDSYNDWSEPQTNPQNPVLTDTVTVKVSQLVTSIDFASYTADSVLLFTTNDPALRADSFSVDITGENAKCSASIKASATGRIASADLQKAVIAMYGRRGVERILNVTVGQLESTRTADGIVVVKYNSDPFVLRVTLVSPVISSAYYYIGTATDGKMAKDKKFTHSGQDVYDDPIFTFTFAGNGGKEEMWFVFTDQENITDEWANLKDWNEVYGYVGAETGTSGTFARRSQMGAENSFKVDGSAASYTFIINMIEQTYEIKTNN